jgi:translocation and assembly module TamB
VISTTFSGNLTVKGPLLGNAIVSGQIDLGRTEIQLPDRLSGSATAIDVQHVNAPAGFVPPEPRTGPAAAGGAPTSGGLTLDVALSGNSGVFVRGFGIDAELGGALRVAGSTGNPQAVGGLQLQRGRIEAFGRRFEFTRGTLTFAGSLVPVVDFAATTQTSDAVVTLNVTGPATDPQIHFTSSSGLPEEEVLSRLLFDRGVGKLSAAQALQLVGAVGQLTGASGGGIVSRIRKSTGLDDLDIRQNATGGTIVGIGKRINDNVRLGVEGGTGSASGRVVIDLDITKNLKASAGAGQDGSGKVGLTYEREY